MLPAISGEEGLKNNGDRSSMEEPLFVKQATGDRYSPTTPGPYRLSVGQKLFKLRSGVRLSVRLLGGCGLPV